MSEYVPFEALDVDTALLQGFGPVIAHATIAPTIATFEESFTVPVIVALAAATYGPTKGPPAPVGAEPAGTTAVVEMSVSARLRFTRPLPV